MPATIFVCPGCKSEINIDHLVRTVRGVRGQSHTVSHTEHIVSCKCRQYSIKITRVGPRELQFEIVQPNGTGHSLMHFDPRSKIRMTYDDLDATTVEEEFAQYGLPPLQ